MRFRRIDHGFGVKTRRYEVMVCFGGFYTAWSVEQWPGWMRVCIGPARLYLDWPSRTLT